MRLLKKITMMMIVYWYLFSNHYTRECIHTGESELAFDDLRVAGDALVIVAIIAKAAPAVLAAVSDGRGGGGGGGGGGREEEEEEEEEESLFRRTRGERIGQPCQRIDRQSISMASIKT
jgi:hypothetical protein